MKKSSATTKSVLEVPMDTVGHTHTHTHTHAHIRLMWGTLDKTLTMPFPLVTVPSMKRLKYKGLMG